MSNLSTWGSKIGNHDEFTKPNNGKDSQEYSVLEAYLGKHESHEQISLGYGSSSKKESTGKHMENMKGYIYELDKDLPK